MRRWSSLRRDLDHDRLEVGHLFEREAAPDTSDAALLACAPAERKVCLPVVGGLVDVDPARVELVREAQGAREVFCVDSAEQAVRSPPPPPHPHPTPTPHPPHTHH